ncbi:hypothetical protein ASD56_00055 [Microbacterium sp. Root166]|uniref:glycosyltransferase n=1 Tax=Microbacterium sp. Root166 TaxID=1736478 RepID=UPI0007004435|nr:glycosyltransferase [Microbacterium sp. Root166]KQZ84832.1 hypothetical protein ASD56_00055 [Microbacterium sp. Root166]
MPRAASIDLTVVITTHAEGRLLRPTLRSVASAMTDASTAGVACELLIMCDNADEATRAEANRWTERAGLAFAVRMLEVSLGESGASRNAGATAALGEFVGFVDGDDLVSENYFTSAMAVLRATDGPAIVHPDYVISFGARSVIWRTDPTDHAEASYRDLIRHNLWPSSATTRRSVYLEHPYRSLHPGSGYGPEDWVWNIDTSAAGVTHLTAPDTVFFYRVRERGGVNNRHALSILPWFDIAQLRKALPEAAAPVPLTPANPHPRGLRGIGHRAYTAVLPVARWSTSWLTFEAKHHIYRTVRWVFRLGAGDPEKPPAPEVPPGVATALQHAVEIDPAVSWTAHRVLSLPVWHAHDDGYAEYLESAIDDIGDRGQVLVMVPWLGVGGADLVALNYAKALNASDGYRGRVTILATSLAERTRIDLIPDDLNFVQLDERWLGLDPGMRSRLLAQLLILVRPELIVSVNCHHFTEALPTYDRQILDGTRAFVTLFAFDRIGPGYPTNPITDDSHREYLDRIDGVITDNTTTASLVSEILALPEERILVHRQPALDDVPALRTDSAAYRDETFSAERPFRLLWPHRLDGEKRPDVLVDLANELRRRGIPAVVEVSGQRVLTADGDTLMHDLKSAGVIYRGPYSGGLSALPTDSYHALLLTSQSEGLPLVLVQSLLLSLPVIASGVGGVPDIIIAGETGLLTEGPDDIAGFADAVELLITNSARRRSLIERGHAFAAEKHSWSTFTHTTRAAFAPTGASIRS